MEDNSIKDSLSAFKRLIEEARGRFIAEDWMEKNPTYFPCQESSDWIGEYIKQHNLAYTWDSLDKAYEGLLVHLRQKDLQFLHDCGITAVEFENDRIKEEA